jgi:TRAP-type C4-dicarboxylate transport system substrate-binding protein
VRALLAAAGLAALAGPAAADEPLRLRIVGGLAGINQFTQHEEPFWTKRIGELSGGRIAATIHPFDRSGLRGQDMLQLMKLGVVPFGTTLLSIAGGDEPELSGVDLPGLNPDIATLEKSVTAYRPHLREVLQDRYGVELLGIYAYPAQVLFCGRSFKGLKDLAGRKVRTSSVAQSEFVTALGGTPVIIPFAEMVGAVQHGVVDCAITGTLSGFETGLFDVTTHVHTMALSWGLSFFGANRTAWESIAPDLRATIQAGVSDLEQHIWEAAGRETARGLACNAGTMSCSADRFGRMTLVPVSADDDERRRELLVESVLPAWIERCGPSCVQAWNGTLAPVTGIQARGD